MNKYNEIYKTNNVWGVQPSDLVVKVVEKLESNSAVLDLGCGQGRNSIFLAGKGFKVDAVDHSVKGLEKIVHNNISTFLADVRNFEIELNKYSTILAIAILQFLPKEDISTLVERIKKNLKPQGFFVASVFIQENGFQEGELKEWFNDFEIIHYKEYIFNDPGHRGREEPHQHHVAKIIAKKVFL